MKALVLWLCMPANVALLTAQPTADPPPGILWNVQGSWRTDGGSVLQPGSAILPGALLQPDSLDEPHSILVLLPDGQRLYSSCSSQTDCARGVRVPKLTRVPSSFERTLLQDALNAMPQGIVQMGTVGTPPRIVPPVKDEAVVIVDARSHVMLTGIAEHLPKGHYTYDLERKVGPVTVQQHLSFDKGNGPASISLPGGGLYEVRISDAMGRKRISLYLAATAEGEPKKFSSVERARKVIDEWTEVGPGWPVHDLLRLYMVSLAEQAAGR